MKKAIYTISVKDGRPVHLMGSADMSIHAILKLAATRFPGCELIDVMGETAIDGYTKPLQVIEADIESEIIELDGPSSKPPKIIKLKPSRKPARRARPGPKRAPIGPR